MYRPFNLSSVIFNSGTTELLTIGESINESHKAAVRETLDAYLSPNGKIDGSKLQENWFPQITADIFLSHSHKDEELAKIIAGWLKKEFGLESFIDSCVWGYSEHLLKQIDDAYCLNSNGETYSYDKRNGSTSHVHMMLSTALGMMIDNTECLFFLNTPNALTSEDAVSKTKSPWIYAEIAMTQIVRRKSPERPRKLVSLSEDERPREVASEDFSIEYTMKTDSLTHIDEDTLKEWATKYGLKKEHPLDVLYAICGNKGVDNVTESL